MVRRRRDGDGDGFVSAYPGGPDNVPVPKTSLDHRIAELERKYEASTSSSERESLKEQWSKLVTVRARVSMRKPGKGLKPNKVRAGRDKTGATQSAVGHVGDVRLPNRLLGQAPSRSGRRPGHGEIPIGRKLPPSRSGNFRNDPGRRKTDLEQRLRVDSPFMYEWNKQEEEDRKAEAKRLAAALRGHTADDGPFIPDIVRTVSDSRQVKPVYVDLTPEELMERMEERRAARRKRLGKSIIKRRGNKGWARFQPGRRDPARYKKPSPKSTPEEITGSHGHGHRPHGPSILWPALYEHLRAKGYTKGKAARISNAAWKKKRVGMRTNTPTSVRGVVKSNAIARAWDNVLSRTSEAATPGEQ